MNVDKIFLNQSAHTYIERNSPMYCVSILLYLLYIHFYCVLVHVFFLSSRFLNINLFRRSLFFCSIWIWNHDVYNNCNIERSKWFYENMIDDSYYDAAYLCVLCAKSFDRMTNNPKEKKRFNERILLSVYGCFDTFQKACKTNWMKRNFYRVFTPPVSLCEMNENKLMPFSTVYCMMHAYCNDAFMWI